MSRRNAMVLATALAWMAAAGALADGAELRFYATPVRVYGGDAVTFHYLGEKGLARESIASWAWDFDGDGTVDARGTGAAGIDATWYAVFDANDVEEDGFRHVLPRLMVTATDGRELVQEGMTEDYYGLDAGTKAELVIRPYNARTAELSVDFSGGPRLMSLETGTGTATARFYADAELRQAGRITGYRWNFGDGTVEEGTKGNATHAYRGKGAFDVTLTVSYVLDKDKTATNELSETKAGYIVVEDDKGELSLGRAYRKGFPDEYTWSDIVKAYSARGVDEKGQEDRYVYFHHLEKAYDKASADLFGDTADEGLRTTFAETANELLQGQVVLGNARLAEALRLKYPRMAEYDPENPPETLPAPPGVREETQAIDVALLDFYAALIYPANAIYRYGPGILRSRAVPGAEPYPAFPRYISFLDPSLSPYPVPIKNEYWQMATCLERMGLGSMEKAKKLFRLSLSDKTARQEAKEECKKSGLQSYLGMALLAACQSEDDFELNEGNLCLAHLKNARDLFEQINAGLTPLGDNGDFIPNESFSAIYQDAQEAVSDVREAEVAARQEDRTYDSYQTQLRAELLNQRASYITPLYNLTHIDPELYNNLATVDDQRDFKNAVRTRVKSLEENYPNADPAALGELGELVLAVLDQQMALLQSVESVKNLLERVKISQWAAATIVDATLEIAKQQAALDIVYGTAQGLLSQRIGWTTSPGAMAGGALLGTITAAKDMLSAMQQLTVQGVSAAAEIKTALLDLGNLQIQVERQKNALAVAELQLDNALTRMDRLIADLAHTRETAADLYFQDPSFRVVVSRAMERAESEMDYAIDRLYRLAKTLEYEWAEAYQNPVVVPINCNESASLENPLFDQFTQLDSLFNATCADETKDYLDALKAWDSKLRRISVTSVRGPNNAGPVTAEPISLREDILGFRTDNGEMTMAESVQAFRTYLAGHRTNNYWNVENPSLEFTFATTIADNSLFPATAERWNMRIDTIAVDIYAESGFSTKQVAEVTLTESGLVSIRRFWAEPPWADDLMHLSFLVGRSDRTAYGITIPAKINGATGGRPAAEFSVAGLKGRPIAATQWVLKIDTENPANKDIDFSKIKDIVVRFTYTYGNPPEFLGF